MEKPSPLHASEMRKGHESSSCSIAFFSSASPFLKICWKIISKRVCIPRYLLKVCLYVCRAVPKYSCVWRLESGDLQCHPRESTHLLWNPLECNPSLARSSLIIPIYSSVSLRGPPVFNPCAEITWAHPGIFPGSYGSDSGPCAHEASTSLTELSPSLFTLPL